MKRALLILAAFAILALAASTASADKPYTHTCVATATADATPGYEDFTVASSGYQPDSFFYLEWTFDPGIEYMARSDDTGTIDQSTAWPTGPGTYTVEIHPTKGNGGPPLASCSVTVP